jgi:GNAT superfamily N-acetyltransferase
MKRGHRLIILPPYQGLGLGVLLSSWVGQHYKDRGLRFRATSTHPSLIHQRLKSPKWEFVHKKDHKETYEGDSIRGRFSAGFRSTYTFEFVG